MLPREGDRCLPRHPARCLIWGRDPRREVHNGVPTRHGPLYRVHGEKVQLLPRWCRYFVSCSEQMWNRDSSQHARPTGQEDVHHPKVGPFATTAAESVQTRTPTDTFWQAPGRSSSIMRTIDVCSDSPVRL
jgi:hypothetical protein